MKIILKPGETLEIGFADSKDYDLDGFFEVEFKARTDAGPGHIRLTTDLTDNQGRLGEIFKEEFSQDGGGFDME